MPLDTRNALRDSAAGPQRARGDEGEVQQHSLRDQIEADRYLDGREGVETRTRGLRFNRLAHPGAA
jgi:hypothetical protein